MMTQNQKMFATPQNWKQENLQLLPHTPEDQLRNLSMADSTSDIFKPLKFSQNALEPWVTPAGKKTETLIKFSKKSGLLKLNKLNSEGNRILSERNSRKNSVLGHLDNIDKKGHTFIIRPRQKCRSRNLQPMSIEEALNLRSNTQIKPSTGSTIDTFHQQSFSNIGNLRKTSENFLLEQLDSHQFIPIKRAYQEIRKIQMANLSEFYSSTKQELTFKPVQAFIYPLSLNSIENKKSKKENKKIGRFEQFINYQKKISDKRGRKFSIKKI